MKAINWIISTVQAAAVVCYIIFYNVQYFWGLKGTIINLVNIIIK